MVTARSPNEVCKHCLRERNPKGKIFVEEKSESFFGRAEEML